MTDIIVNKTKVKLDGLSGIKTVSFDFLNHKVYSAQKIEAMCGFFVSSVIDAGSSLINWKEMLWDAVKPIGTDVAIYVKSAISNQSLDISMWNGPYFNVTTDISNLNGRYLQFMVALCNNGTKSDYDRYFVTPMFNSITLSYYSSSNASKFYTQAFNLGFVPKNILLTYNGDIPSDSIVRFAVSGFDSVDPNDYQYIAANKIEELDKLSLLSDKIKLLIEMIGNSQVPIVIHEVALMFSGDQQLRLNDMSSSSESSSSSY